MSRLPLFAATLSLAALTALATGCAGPGRSLQRHDGLATDIASAPSATPGLVHRVGTFDAGDGTPLFREAWLPASGAPTAVLVVIHGLKDYGHRYEALALALCSRGFAVHAFDLRGHGHSPGIRSFVPHFEQPVTDAQRFLTLVRAEHPDVPLFLMGHSMGGAIATLAAATSPVPLDGLVLSAPALQASSTVSGFQRGAVGFTSAVFPTLEVLDLPDRDQSRDPAVVSAIAADPLIDRGAVPARTAGELLHAFSLIDSAMPRLALPLLVIHGTHDRMTEIEGSRSLVRRAGSGDKTFAELPGAFHNLLQDSDRAKVQALVVDWLSQHAHSR